MPFRDLSWHEFYNQLSSSDPQNVKVGLRALWDDVLPAEDLSILLSIETVNDAPGTAGEKFEHYNGLLTGWDEEQQLDAVGQWQKWIDLTREAHFAAHHNGLEANIEARGSDGQSIPGAVQRGIRNGSVSEQIWPSIQQSSQTSIPTPHPTQTTGAEYTTSFYTIRERYADFLQSPSKTTFQALYISMQSFANVTEIIPVNKLSGVEEGDIGFYYIANGLLASATAARTTIDALTDAGRQHNMQLVGASPKIEDYMLADMSDWTVGDADGNPERTSDVTRQGVEGDFRRIRYWLADQIEACIPQTGRKRMLSELAAELHQDDNGYNFQADPDGSATAEALFQASLRQEGNVRLQLQKLEAIMRKKGWFWRGGDLRQSSEIHEGIVELMDAHGDDLNAVAIDLEQKIADAQNPKERKKWDVYLQTVLRLDIPKKYPDAFRQYIISNYAGAKDAGNLYRILKAAGVSKGLKLCLLHEAGKDLMSVGNYLEELSKAPWFEEYLKENDYTITIKVAMSDSQRESGPGAYLLQLHAPTDGLLSGMKTNRVRRAKGLRSIRINTQYGGSDDYVRGGNDITNYYFEDARSFKGAACLHEFDQREVREASGPNILATIQGRQRNSTLGGARSAEITMERMAACAINFFGFTHRDHSPEDLSRFREEYAANRRAMDILLPLLLPNYQAIRGALLDEIGYATVSWQAVRGLNTGCRPDSRPIFTDDKDVDLERLYGAVLSDTRAITSKFGNQIAGLNLTAWYGLHVLRQIPLAERQELYRTSAHFRDFVFRPLLVLAHTKFVRVWDNAALPEPTFAEKQRNARAFNTVFKEQRLCNLGDDPYAVPQMTEAQYNNMAQSVVEVLGLEDTKENRRTVLLSWTECMKIEAERALVETITGIDYGVNASAEKLLASFPSHYGDIKEPSNAVNRIGAEIADLDHLMDPLYAWMAILMQPTRTQYINRGEFTHHEWLLTLCGSGIVTACQTASAFTHSSTAQHDLHLSYAKRAMSEVPKRYGRYSGLPQLRLAI